MNHKLNCGSLVYLDILYRLLRPKKNPKKVIKLSFSKLVKLFLLLRLELHDAQLQILNDMILLSIYKKLLLRDKQFQRAN